ncbi:MAG: hypothetical protein ACK4M1_08565 [Flavobacterium sp.]
MKHFFITLFLSTFTLLSAQTKFEKGYYISTNGTRTDGFIKNNDWKNNPTKIEFKNNLEEESIEINTIQISEFEIENITKYKRFDVNIEKSSIKTGQISNNSRIPQFKKENLLLKVLIEGKASLYYFYDNGIEKFFFSSDKKEIEQLIFLSYLASVDDMNTMKEKGIDDIIPNSTVLYDRTYKKQLNQYVNCNNSRDVINKLSFSKTTLEKFFKEYNECEKSEFKKFDQNNKSTFKLKASLISNMSSLDLVSYNDSYFGTDFGSSFNLGFGLEAEVILPFNNNKWSVIMEPSYNSYEDSAHLKRTFYGSTYEQDVEVEYSYIQVPLGVRHYFYLNDTSSIFINIAYNAKFNIGSSGIKYEVTEQSNLEIFPSLNNFIFGAGFNYKRYSIETRFFSNTQILKTANESRYADFKNISFNLRYQLF